MRKLKIALILGGITFGGIILILALIGPQVGDIWSDEWRIRTMVASDPMYCEHAITDDLRVRTAATVYAGKYMGEQIDPNTWESRILLTDLIFNGYIIMPFVDYEITRDGGETWSQFWRYEDGIYTERERCRGFGKLDEANFWIWNSYWLAVTHDGGETWIRRNIGQMEFDVGHAYIGTLEFYSENIGRITYRRSDMVVNLETRDGGYTWEVEAIHVTPYASPHPIIVITYTPENG